MAAFRHTIHPESAAPVPGLDQKVPGLMSKRDVHVLAPPMMNRVVDRLPNNIG
jgi:hypothetical protein